MSFNFDRWEREPLRAVFVDKASNLMIVDGERVYEVLKQKIEKKNSLGEKFVDAPQDLMDLTLAQAQSAMAGLGL